MVPVSATATAAVVAGCNIGIWLISNFQPASSDLIWYPDV